MTPKKYHIAIDTCAGMDRAIEFDFDNYDDVQNMIGYCIDGRKHIVIEIFRREETE